MFGFSNAQLGAAGRYLLTFGSGYLVAKGYLTTDQAATLTGEIIKAAPAIVGLIAAIYGVAKRSDTATVDSAAKVIEDPNRVAKIDPEKIVNLVASAPVEAIVANIDNYKVELASADPLNPTTAKIVPESELPPPRFPSV